MTDDLRAAFDQRLADVQAEHAKCLESWDRSRLDGERRLLLWLHAEAVWRLETERLAHAVTIADRDEARTVLAAKPAGDRHADRAFPRGWGDR